MFIVILTSDVVLCINRYSPNELRYLPLNTALFEPPLDPELPALDSEPDSDEGEDGKDEKKNKNSSVSPKTETPVDRRRKDNQTQVCVLCVYSPVLLSSGQFFRQHIRRGEPGGSRWTQV